MSIKLSELGFDPALFSAALTELDRDHQILGRVVAVERGRGLVLTESGQSALLPVAGRLTERPVVGDWVVVGPGDVIGGILPRRGVLARRAAGGGGALQVIASHLDRVLVVTAVGADFSPRRLERYVTLVQSGGAEPVVVLTKTDLPFDVGATMRQIEEAAPGLALCLVSGATEDVAELAPHLRPRETVAVVGSSGVGKSTLVNALLGRPRQATRDVRASDDKGRHTTTRRELVTLPGGAHLIDTPGMREVGLTGDEAAVDATFGDVAALAEGCRFADCAHEGEPGCRVRAALDAGELTEARWASHRRLKKEAAYEARRAEVHTRLDTKKRWKKIHLEMRARKKIDPKLR